VVSCGAERAGGDAAAVRQRGDRYEALVEPGQPAEDRIAVAGQPLIQPHAELILIDRFIVDAAEARRQPTGRDLGAGGIRANHQADPHTASAPAPQPHPVSSTGCRSY
jgi:hypothetical protein